MFDFLAEMFAWPLMQFYAVTGSYAASIMLITVVVMAVTTPLTLKSTKGMLEMQRIQPELRKLQQQHRGDRQTLNQEMMKLYQEHKVNPLASCFPLLLQMPVFFGMFTLLRGLTQNRDEANKFVPRIIDPSSELYESLRNSTKMVSWGLDLSQSPQQMLKDNVGRGLLYILIVVFLGFLYWVQQRMIANRSVSPTMSPVQAKIMQYLPVAFAVFQIFFPLGLIVYYIWQTLLRIGQQHYITRRFYHGDTSLGRQAQAASAEARELAKSDKAAGARPTLGSGRTTAKPASGGVRSAPARPVRGQSGRPAANRPAPSGKAPRPQAPAARPAKGATPARPMTQPVKPAKGSAPAKPAKPVKPVKPQKPQKPQKPSG